MGVLFLLRAPGESCGTAKSSFGKEGGRGGEASCTRAPFHPVVLPKMPFRKEAFVSFPLIPSYKFQAVVSRYFARHVSVQMSVSFYDRIFPFVFPPPRENKSRLLKTNLLTIQKNRDASNNRDSIIRSETLEESFSKKVFYCEWNLFSCFEKRIVMCI